MWPGPSRENSTKTAPARGVGAKQRTVHFAGFLSGVVGRTGRRPSAFSNERCRRGSQEVAILAAADRGLAPSPPRRCCQLLAWLLRREPENVGGRPAAVVVGSSETTRSVR